MPTIVRKFPRPTGWLVGALVVAACHALIISVNQNPGTINMPDIFGFPMIFYKSGGAIATTEFRPAALVVDIAWAIAVPLFFGLHLRHRVDLTQRRPPAQRKTVAP